MVSPPNDMPPPESEPEFNSAFQDALNRAVQSYMETEFVPAIASLRAQISANIESIARTVPSSEQLVGQVITTLEARAQAQADQTQAAQVAALRERAVAANGSSPQGAPPATSPVADDFKAKAMVLLDVVNNLFDKGFDKWLAFQNLKLAQTNPIAMAKHMAATDPVSARFVGMMLSADPWQAQIPGMMANTADATSRAIVTGLLRAGWNPPGGAAPPLVPMPASPNTPGAEAGGPAPGSWPNLSPNPTVKPSAAPSDPAQSPSSPGSAVMQRGPVNSIWATLT